MRRSLVPAMAIALILAALAPASRAAYDPVASGQTRFRFDPAFLSLLHRHGVTIRALLPATLHAGVASFPVAGGKFDPVRARGTVGHEGGLRFERGGRRLLFRALQLKTTARHSPWSARLGGSQLKLAGGAQVTVSRQGFSEQVRATSLGLSANAATRLAKKLGLRGAVKPGQPLGASSTATQPQTVTLLQAGKAELTLDPAFEAKLRSLFVAVNPIFPAEHPGPFTMPVFGGKVAPDGSEGAITVEGSIEFLQLGGGQVFWAESALDLAARAVIPEVEVEPSPPYAGKLGPTLVAALTAMPFSADPGTRRFTIAGAPLILSPGMAQTFNEVFAEPQGRKDVFAAGEVVGALSLKLEGQ